jgi:excisionase family DNA binding protein
LDDVPQQLALRPREAAKALGIGVRLLWQLTKEGRIPCVRVGGAKRQTVLYPVGSLQAWLARESGAGESDASDADRVPDRNVA